MIMTMMTMIMTLISILLIMATLPFSLLMAVKVVQVSDDHDHDDHDDDHDLDPADHGHPSILTAHGGQSCSGKCVHRHNSCQKLWPVLSMDIVSLHRLVEVLPTFYGRQIY